MAISSLRAEPTEKARSTGFSNSRPHLSSAVLGQQTTFHILSSPPQALFTRWAPIQSILVTLFVKSDSGVFARTRSLATLRPATWASRVQNDADWPCLSPPG